MTRMTVTGTGKMRVVTTTKKKTTVGFLFFSFLVCFTGQKQMITASLLRDKSRHKNVAHIPPIQGFQ
jgi:hypothetical protein